MGVNMSKNHETETPVFFQRHPFLLMLLTGLIIPCVLFIAASLISVYFDPVNWPAIILTGPFGLVFIIPAFCVYCDVFCDETISKFQYDKLLKYKGRLVLGLVVFSALLFVFVKFNIALISPEFEEHVPYERIHVPGAPPTGTDYSYCRRPRGTGYCECTMSEKNFNDWIASESRWDKRTPITEENPEGIPNFMQKENIVVTDGIHAGFGTRRGGRTVFDRQTSRAYYWTFY